MAIWLDYTWKATTNAEPRTSLCDYCERSCKVDRQYQCQICLVVKCDNFKRIGKAEVEDD